MSMKMPSQQNDDSDHQASLMSNGLEVGCLRLSPMDLFLTYTDHEWVIERNLTEYQLLGRNRFS